MNEHEPRPDWWIERVALGEIPGVGRDDLGEDERRRYDALLASNQSILARHPPVGVREEVHRRLLAEPRAPRRTRWVVGLLPAVAVAAGIVVIANRDMPTERTKGDARLVIHKKSGTDVLQVRDGDTLAAGDLLQVSYTPGGAGYGAVLSIDGRGAVTLHWPEVDGAWAPAVRPDGASLPSAYELDDAPQFERFFLVTCPHRFEARRAMAAAQALARADAEYGDFVLDADCHADALLLKKVTR